MAGWPGQVLELVSYMLAVIFLFANRRIPWLWLVGLGGLSNLVAIGANDGVMPASPVAVRAAGRVLPKGQFLNSAPLLHPRLAFLGDIFRRRAPGHWPTSSVPATSCWPSVPCSYCTRSVSPASPAARPGAFTGVPVAGPGPVSPRLPPPVRSE